MPRLPEQICEHPIAFPRVNGRFVFCTTRTRNWRVRLYVHMFIVRFNAPPEVLQDAYRRLILVCPITIRFD